MSWKVCSPTPCPKLGQLQNQTMLLWAFPAGSLTLLRITRPWVWWSQMRQFLGTSLQPPSNLLSLSDLHSELLRAAVVLTWSQQDFQASLHTPHCRRPPLPTAAFKLLLFPISATADLSGKYPFSSRGSGSSSVTFTVAFIEVWRSKAAWQTGTTRGHLASQTGLRGKDTYKVSKQAGLYRETESQRRSWDGS